MTDILFDNMTATVVYDLEDNPLPAVVNVPNGPFASGTRPQYSGQLVDRDGEGIPALDLASFTLSIVDTLTQEVIVSDVNILNTGRGTVDEAGNFTVTLEVGDTLMDEVPGEEKIQRSLVLDWATIDVPPQVGRHQANFILLRLAGN